MLKRLNQAGDTIVEVMVVLAILGLALGVSYATTNRSLINERNSHENAEATTLLQSQLESLRLLIGDPTQLTQNPGPGGGPFCVNSGSFSDASTATCKTFNGTQYDVSISYVNATRVFTLTATWPDALDSSTPDQVTLSYRAFQ